MKKLFAILAISVAAVSCGNGGENTTTTDSTTINNTIVDTTVVAPAPDTTAAPMADTMHHDTTMAH